MMVFIEWWEVELSLFIKVLTERSKNSVKDGHILLGKQK